ncbi:MAG: hypothetical protein ABJB12_17740 [Pseudomonadota bacterium]
MARSLFITLIGAASLGAALIVGCSDKDAKPTSSKAGESCVRTSDCADGLSCLANVCYASGHVTTPGGGEGGEPSAPPVPSLGSEGESCSSRLDCEAGLGCFNQRCTTPPTTTPMGEGGAPSTGTGIQLGERGETCRVNGDCSTELKCIPSTTTAGVGVCDLSTYGVKATGQVCGGECKAATDCCQLPTLLQTATIKSCKDIDDAITVGAIDCAAAGAASTLCFQQATYCSGCSAKTWDCKDNTCVYKPACVVAVANDTPTGCPTYSRIRTLTALSCNADTKKCQGPTAAVACTTDASCATKPVFDRAAASTDVCSAGECTCYPPSHECYRKCSRDIECAAGSTCDTTSHVCMSVGTCSSDSECATAKHNVDYKCDAGTCKLPCAFDRDCSPSGHGNISGLAGGSSFNNMVCSSGSGFCEDVAGNCTKETQCPAINGLKTFCVDSPTASGSTVSSAVSD